MSTPDIKAPPPPPPSPLADEEAQRRRQAMEDAAIAEAKSTGRGSTIVGGGVMAREAQYARGEMKRKAREDLSL